MDSSSLLDTIVLNSGQTVNGVIDYVTAKHVYVFDFSRYEHSIYTMIAALWRGTYPNREIRFSIYSMVQFPECPLPIAVLLPRVNIKECSIGLEVTKKPHARGYRL